MNREKILVKNTFIIALGTFLPKLASIITLPIVTGYLTKLEYGTYDLILTLVSLILPLFTLQIQSAAFRFLVENRENNLKCCSIITNIITFTIVMSILPLIGVFIYLKNFDIFNRLAICIYFLVDIILNTFQQICRGLGKNKIYSISTILNSFINMLLVVIFILILKMGLLGIICSLIVANLIAITVIAINCKIRNYFTIGVINKSTIKELISYSWPLIPNNLSSWVMTLSDRLLLVFFMGVGTNATYAVAKKIPNLLTSVQSTFSLAWQENASMSSKDEDIDDYYTSMFSNIFRIVIGSCAVLIGFSPILFFLLIKGNYNEAYYQMPILFLGMVFMTLSSYLAGIYIADKKTKEIGITTTIAAIINLFIDIIAIPIIGMYAASISTLVSYIFLFIYRVVDLKKYHTIKFNYAKIVSFICFIFVLSFLSYFNNYYLNIIILILGTLFAILINKNIIIGIKKNIIVKFKKNCDN